MENLQLIPIDGPLPEKVVVPDSFNPDKVLKKAVTQNFLTFMDKAKAYYTRVLTAKANEGIKLFPINLEKQVEEEAAMFAANLFAGYKQTGLIDEFNRPTEKFFEGEIKNAG